MKTTTFSANNVKLIIENTEIEEMAASASISLNPHVTWMKIVLTDDLPNANKQKIPRSEFANVLRTGVFMPLKMGYEEITEGHDEVFPIGTFAHLKTEGNTIEALIALWNREREKDVTLLKERYASGKPIDVSWEVTYTEEETDEEDGSMALKNVSMNGAAIVGMPAYEGRTPVTALSTTSDNKQSSKKGESSDMDEEKYTQRITELEEKVSELETELSESKTELAEIKPKYETLAEFKENYDTEQARLSKIDAIKSKFSEAELKLKDEYIDEKIDMFLEMNDEQLDFFIQELSAFSANEGDEGDEDEDGKASVNLTSSDIPPMNRKTDKVDKQGILKFLNDRNKKEE